MKKVKLSSDQEFYGTKYKKGDIVNFSEKAYNELKPKGKIQEDVE